MVIGVAKIKLYAPWVHSLKEKRMIVKSLCTKLRNKFNISVIEIDAQDVHQTIVIAVACVAATGGFSDSVLEKVIAFVENNTEAEVVEIQTEKR